MDKIEIAFIETQDLQPLVWFRYIDDIFLSGHMVSKLFCVVFMSSIRKSNLLVSQGKKALRFLTLFSVKNSKIIEDLYVKSTDRHQCLHYLSAHPNRKRSVVFTQTLRISRLCSYEENFIKHKANMKSRF